MNSHRETTAYLHRVGRLRRRGQAFAGLHELDDLRVSEPRVRLLPSGEDLPQHHPERPLQQDTVSLNKCKLRIRILAYGARPIQMSGRIAVHFNGNSVVQFEMNAILGRCE